MHADELFCTARHPALLPVVSVFRGWLLTVPAASLAGYRGRRGARRQRHVQGPEDRVPGARHCVCAWLALPGIALPAAWLTSLCTSTPARVSRFTEGQGWRRGAAAVYVADGPAGGAHPGQSGLAGASRLRVALLCYKLHPASERLASGICNPRPDDGAAQFPQVLCGTGGRGARSLRADRNGARIGERRGCTADVLELKRGRRRGAGVQQSGQEGVLASLGPRVCSTAAVPRTAQRSSAYRVAHAGARSGAPLQVALDQVNGTLSQRGAGSVDTNGSEPQRVRRPLVGAPASCGCLRSLWSARTQAFRSLQRAWLLASPSTAAASAAQGRGTHRARA
jgi:hypothetical protein